jgi:hypothetical protein
LLRKKFCSAEMSERQMDLLVLYSPGTPKKILASEAASGKRSAGRTQGLRVVPATDIQ